MRDVMDIDLRRWELERPISCGFFEEVKPKRTGETGGRQRKCHPCRRIREVGSCSWQEATARSSWPASNVPWRRWLRWSMKRDWCLVEESLFRHLCSRCYHVGRVSTGEVLPRRWSHVRPCRGTRLKHKRTEPHMEHVVTGRKIPMCRKHDVFCLAVGPAPEHENVEVCDIRRPSGRG